MASITGVPGTPSTAESVPLGVSSAFLRQFLAQRKLAGLTTAQVCESIVKLVTEYARCSYVQHLVSQQRGVGTPMCTEALVGPATVYVIHAWGCRAELTLTTLIEFAARRARSDAGNPDARPVFFWIDLFCANHHVPAVFDDVVLEEMYKRIRLVGETVVVESYDFLFDRANRDMFAYAERHSPLRRGWCNVELTITMGENIPWSVATSAAELNMFLVNSWLYEGSDDLSYDLVWSLCGTGRFEPLFKEKITYLRKTYSLKPKQQYQLVARAICAMVAVYCAEQGLPVPAPFVPAE